MVYQKDDDDVYLLQSIKIDIVSFVIYNGGELVLLASLTTNVHRLSNSLLFFNTVVT